MGVHLGVGVGVGVGVCVLCVWACAIALDLPPQPLNLQLQTGLNESGLHAHVAVSAARPAGCWSVPSLLFPDRLSMRWLSYALTNRLAGRAPRLNHPSPQLVECYGSPETCGVAAVQVPPLTPTATLY